MSEDVAIFDFGGQNKQNEFDKLLIDLSADIKEPAPLVCLNAVPVFTRGNISCISGKAKSRKTFLINLLTSQFLELSHTAKVIIYDSEQALFHVQRSTKRIHRLLDWDECKNNSQLRVFALRELSPEQRTEFVADTIARFKPDLVFIDGVRDLLHDFNNITESSDIVNLLMKLSSENDCHICCVLHENKGDASLRGHAGTELMNKAETVISVSKPPDCNHSTVEPKVCRNLPFEKFHFIVNDNGLPQLCSPQIKPKAIDRTRTVFADILANNKTLSYADLKADVMLKCSVKERAAETRIKTALNDGIILKNTIGHYCLFIDEAEIETEPEVPF